jgi:hypothetical protein
MLMGFASLIGGGNDGKRTHRMLGEQPKMLANRGIDQPMQRELPELPCCARLLADVIASSIELLLQAFQFAGLFRRWPKRQSDRARAHGLRIPHVPEKRGHYVWKTQAEVVQAPMLAPRAMESGFPLLKERLP